MATKSDQREDGLTPFERWEPTEDGDLDTMRLSSEGAWLYLGDVLTFFERVTDADAYTTEAWDMVNKMCLALKEQTDTP